MKVTIRNFRKEDVPQMCVIWNRVVEEGMAFPQLENLNETSGWFFFEE